MTKCNCNPDKGEACYLCASVSEKARHHRLVKQGSRTTFAIAAHIEEEVEAETRGEAIAFFKKTYPKSVIERVDGHIVSPCVEMLKERYEAVTVGITKDGCLVGEDKQLTLIPAFTIVWSPLLLEELGKEEIQVTYLRHVTPVTITMKRSNVFFYYSNNQWL